MKVQKSCDGFCGYNLNELSKKELITVINYTYAELKELKRTYYENLKWK